MVVKLLTCSAFGHRRCKTSKRHLVEGLSIAKHYQWSGANFTKSKDGYVASLTIQRQNIWHNLMSFDIKIKTIVLNASPWLNFRDRFFHRQV